MTPITPISDQSAVVNPTGTILDLLADSSRKRALAARKRWPFEKIARFSTALAQAERSASHHHADRLPFEQAIMARSSHAGSQHPDGIAFICECKKASPSKGLIASDFPYLEIARSYEEAGAACISVLTEPERFQGSDAYLAEIAPAVGIPCLRKDFTVDEYQIYEAKALGASAVLLICALLDEKTIARFLGICDELRLSALVEAHDEDEVRRALDAGARIIGVNNRDLRDFTVDLGTSIRLRRMVPDDVIFIAESGIDSPEAVAALKGAGVDAVLVGEYLMRADNRKAALARLAGRNGEVS